MKKVIILSSLFIALNLSPFSDKEIFENSINLYNSGNYEEALDKFKSLLSKGYNNFEIYYNIGCSYFKLEKYGFARFYFEKALLYKPFDKDLYQNLFILYNKILKNPEIGIQEIMTKRVIFFIPLGVLIIIFIITFIVIILMIIFIFNIVRFRKTGLIILSVFLLLNLIITFLFFLQYFEFNKKEFVTIKTTNIYITPSEDNIIYSITEGTKGIFKDEFRDYIRVSLSDGTSGWINKENVIY